MSRYQPGEGVAFPRLMLAAVVVQVQRARALGELGEQAAGFDLGELAGVTDQDEGGSADRGVGEQRAEPSGVDDSRLVQHHDPARVQSAWLPGGRVGLVGVGEQPGE
jgi:hypothetical protein